MPSSWILPVRLSCALLLLLVFAAGDARAQVAKAAVPIRVRPAPVKVEPVTRPRIEEQKVILEGEESEFDRPREVRPAPEVERPREQHAPVPEETVDERSGARTEARTTTDANTASTGMSTRGTAGPAGGVSMRMRSMPSAAESAALVGRINQSRQGLSGVNRIALPAGEARRLANGTVAVRGNGISYNVRSDGTLARVSADRSQATFSHDGKVLSAHLGTTSVRNLAHGQRLISNRLDDGSTLMSTGRQSGYLERMVQRRDQTSIVRTYVARGRTYTREYRRASYRGLLVKDFVPRTRYSSGFYGWAYAGWRHPVVYAWGWNRAAWYRYYASYFVPWPSYEGANFWLTDWLFSETLEDGYGMQQAQDGDAPVDMTAPDAGGQDVPDGQAVNESVTAAETAALGAEVKSAIADQIQEQLLADDAAASAPATNVASVDPPDSELGRALEPGYLFVVSSPLNVTVPREGRPMLAGLSRSCTLSPGDVIAVKAMPEVLNLPANVGLASSTGVPGSPAVRLRPAVMEVKATLAGDCAVGVEVNVSPVELEEMQNTMRARLDDGLKLLAQSKGKEGFPVAPAGSVVAVAPPEPPDPNAAALLQALPGQVEQEQAQLMNAVAGASLSGAP